MQATFALYKTSCKMRKATHIKTYARGNNDAPSVTKYGSPVPALRTHSAKGAPQELKKKNSSTNCLRVPHPKGKIILITDACDVGGGGVPYTNGRSSTPGNCCSATFTLQVLTKMVPEA